jgi:hypothetical protein
VGSRTFLALVYHLGKSLTSLVQGYGILIDLPGIDSVIRIYVSLAYLLAMGSESGI